MSGDKQTTQTQSSQPWSESIPYLKNVMSGAQNTYNSGQGFQYYPGSTVTPFASQTTQALQGTENLASQGNPLAGAAQNQALGVLNSGGISPWQQGALNGTYDVATGQNRINTEGDYRGVLGQAQQPGAIAQNLAGYARGDYVNGGSPEFQKSLDYQSGKLADDINRSYSNMGRYGSGAQTNTLGEQIGNFRNNAQSQELAREQAQQMAAAQALSGEQAGQIGQQAGLLNAITQGQGANLANMVGAGQNIFNAGDTGATQAARYAALGGDIYGQGFLPFQQLSNVGSTYQSQNQAELQDAINRFQAQQQDPWKRLSAYSALVGGTGQLGGTTTATAQQPTNFLSPVGGALAGAQLGSIIPGIGTGIGALGGGLLGLLGL